MTDISRILGLSIEEAAVRAVELHRTGDRIVVLAADTWANPLPPPGETMSDEQVGAFKESLDAFLKVNQVKARHTSVALDTSGLFITTIPLPETATREDIHRQLVWELQQFFPEVAASDFVHDAYRLGVDHAHSTADFLCVAARRHYTRTVQSMLVGRGLRLEIVDTDHFGAEYVLRTAYADSAQKTLLLAGIKKDRVDIGTVKKGALTSYDFATLEAPDSLVTELAQAQEHVAGLDAIVTYGPALDDDALAVLRRTLTVPVEVLDPFRSLEVSAPARLSPGLQLPAHWYAAAVGVGLRTE